MPKMHWNYDLYLYSKRFYPVVPLHQHRFYEIYLFLDNPMKYLVGENSYSLVLGDLLVIPPRHRHMPLISEKPGECDRMVLWLDPTFVQELLAERSGRSSRFNYFNVPRLIHLNLQEMNKLLGLYKTLMEEKNAWQFGRKEIIHALLIQILVELERYTVSSPDKPNINDSGALIYAVVNYLRDNFRCKMTLDQIANHFFVSKYYLSHVFHETMGISIYQYILQLRLESACEMLMQGHSPTNIYSACGFQDYSTFYRAFKSAYGMNPSTFILNSSLHHAR